MGSRTHKRGYAKMNCISERDSERTKGIETASWLCREERIYHFGWRQADELIQLPLGKDDLAIKSKYTFKMSMYHVPMDTLSLTKEARIYNGEKTTSLTSGAGKTGQPLVRE